MPEDLQTIVHKAHSKDPHDRYHTAQAMADDLRAFIDDNPIKARRLSLAQLTTRWAAKRKRLVAAIACVMLLAVVGLAISNSLIIGQRNAARRAESNERAQRLEADRQRKAAERQKLITDENFHLARAAVDTYLTKVSEEQLLDNPGLQPLRKELLESALVYYQGFAKSHGADEVLKSELATAYFRIGKISASIATQEAALVAYQHSLQIRSDLANASRENADFALELAKSYAAVAGCELQLGNRGQAEKNLDYASAAIERAMELGAPSRDAQVELARNKLAQGSIRSAETAKRGESLNFFIDAQDIYKSLLRDDSGDPIVRLELSNAYQNAAIYYANQSKFDNEAATAFRKSIEIRESLRTEFPAVQKYQKHLSSSYHNLANLLRWKDYRKSIEAYKKSLAIRLTLAKQNPQDIALQDSVSSTYYMLGQTYRFMGEPNSAADMTAAQRELLETLLTNEPDLPGYKEGLANNFELHAQIETDRGNYSRSVELWREALDRYHELLASNPNVNSYQHHLLSGYNELAFALAQDGKPDLSNDARQKVIEMVTAIAQEQRSPVFFAMLAEALYHTGQNQQAREAAEKIIELWGDDRPTLSLGGVWWYQSMILRELGEETEAEKIYWHLVEELSKQSTPRVDYLRLRDQTAKALGIVVAELAVESGERVEIPSTSQVVPKK